MLSMLGIQRKCNWSALLISVSWNIVVLGYPIIASILKIFHNVSSDTCTFRSFSLTHTRFQVSTYLTYLLSGNAVLESTLIVIFKHPHPSKITSVIVPSVSIDVIDGVFVLWIFDERCGYDPRNSPRLIISFVVEQMYQLIPIM